MGGFMVLFGFGWIAAGFYFWNRLIGDFLLDVVVTCFAAGTVLFMLGIFVHDLNRKLARMLPKLPHEE